jgi:hypothetical protein
VGYRAGQAQCVIERGQDDAFDVALGHLRNDLATARDGNVKYNYVRGLCACQSPRMGCGFPSPTRDILSGRAMVRTTPYR